MVKMKDEHGCLERQLDCQKPVQEKSVKGTCWRWFLITISRGKRLVSEPWPRRRRRQRSEPICSRKPQISIGRQAPRRPPVDCSEGGALPPSRCYGELKRRSPKPASMLIISDGVASLPAIGSVRSWAGCLIAEKTASTSGKSFRPRYYWRGWSQRAAEFQYQQNLINSWKPWQLTIYRGALATSPYLIKRDSTLELDLVWLTASTLLPPRGAVVSEMLKEPPSYGATPRGVAAVVHGARTAAADPFALMGAPEPWALNRVRSEATAFGGARPPSPDVPAIVSYLISLRTLLAGDPAGSPCPSLDRLRKICRPGGKLPFTAESARQAA